MDKIYNKLVRDNIPDIIKNDGEKPVTRILSNEQYKIELYKKLKEECNEVLESKTKEETLEELADVLEIIKSISELNGESIEKVNEIAIKKRIKRGGFKKRIFLEKIHYF